MDKRKCEQKIDLYETTLSKIITVIKKKEKNMVCTFFLKHLDVIKYQKNCLLNSLKF